MFPNVSDIIATTIEKRSGKIRDNVTKNNALLMRLSQKGKIRPWTGGRLIYEEISFAENGNAAWYSGYDLLSVAAQDVITAAEFNPKQLAVPVTVSGLELLQNAGPEQKIDLLQGRLSVAESTMKNYICQGIYSDGTGSGSKTITGLDAAVATTATSGTYGAIDRATWTFWRNQTVTGTSLSASNVQGFMNSMWAACARGADTPDLIAAGSSAWAYYLASLQSLQRFTGTETGQLGFATVKYMTADVVLDGGIGGFATDKDFYFLNTDYLHFRPHSERNMKAIGGERMAVNQDATVQVLGWAGNLTCSGAQFQGRLHGT